VEFFKAKKSYVLECDTVEISKTTVAV